MAVFAVVLASLVAALVAAPLVAALVAVVVVAAAVVLISDVEEVATLVLEPSLAVELPVVVVRSPDPLAEPSTISLHPDEPTAEQPSAATKIRFFRVTRESIARRRKSSKGGRLRYVLASVIFYKSSDLVTILTIEMKARGETWQKVTQRMGKSGRSFRRQVHRPDPNPSADLFFKCLRILKLELAGCRRVSEFVNLLNHERCEAGLSYRQLAKAMIPNGSFSTVSRVLADRHTPRLMTLLAIACALGVHPEIHPARKIVRRSSGHR